MSTSAANAFSMMPTPWLNIASVPAPDPTIAPSKKDEVYCNKKARFHMSCVNNTRINWFRQQFAVNGAFSMGAWGIDEDRADIPEGRRKEHYP